MQQFMIKKNEAGQRLDKFLHKYLKEASGSFLYKMLRKKNITLNDKKAEGKEKLEEGDCIRFYFSEETFLKFKGEGKESSGEKSDISRAEPSREYQKAFHTLNGIEIIEENQDIILLNKPAGVLSQKAQAGDLSLNEWLIGYLLERKEITIKQLETFKPSVCNRLDRNTSGLVVCGKSLPGSQKMSQLLRERSVHKYYRTFVKGDLTRTAHVKGYLCKDGVRNKVLFKLSLSPADRGFEQVETRYTPLTRYDGRMTYLEVELITGKPHQIRAHLAHLGHPILGDSKYGDGSFNHSFRPLKLQWQLLHAYRLEMPRLEADFEELSGKIYVAPEPGIFEELKEYAIKEWGEIRGRKGK